MARAAAAFLALLVSMSMASPALGARSSDDLAETYLRRATASFADLGAPAELVAAMDAADGSYEATLPVGDLDRDALPDAVTLRAVPRADFDPDLSLRAYRGYTITLRGRKGTDGGQLWTYTEQAAALFFVPTHLGEQDGVLVVSYEVNYSNLSAAYPYVFTMHLTQLRGDGTTAWDQRIAGPLANVNFVGSTGAMLPTFRGFVDAVGDPSDDPLVEALHYVRNGRTDNKPVLLEAIVLDGSTGRPASHAAHAVPRADYYTLPFVIPAPDLDGDGSEDSLFVIPRGAAPPVSVPPELLQRAELSVSSGADGTTVWSTQAIDFGGAIAIVQLDDATGDGTPDLAVSSYAPAGQPGVFLVSGASGATVWSREGRETQLLGDVNGDGRADVGVISYHAFENHIAIRIEGVDAGGAVAYVEQHELHGIAGATGLEGSVGAVGDVDGDGALDLAFHLRATFAEAPAREADTLVSGANGRAMRALDREVSLGGTVSGLGADLLRVSPRSQGVELTATRGATGDSVWATLIGQDRTITATTFAAADLDGDGRDELLVNAFGAEGTVLAVLGGRDGNTLWSA